MDREKRIRPKRNRSGSFLWQMLDRFTAFLYSLFIFGRVGESMSDENTYCRRSFLAQSFSNRNKAKINIASLNLSRSLSKNVIVRMLSGFGKVLAYLRLNVYGTFFTFYGLTSAIAHYIIVLMDGQSIIASKNLNVIISSAIIAVCSLPLLFSTQSATGAIAKSRIMRKVVLDFFDIPEEKLKNTKQYGGKQYVLFAVISAIASGILAHFLGQWYAPVALLCVIGIYLIFSNPEAGVILTIVAVPFLQYAGMTKTGLVIMILITSASYLLKLIQRRRSMDFSPELTMVFLFCSFIFAGSIFTLGGVTVLNDAISYVIMTAGGFFLTYNLISSKKGIKICVKTLMSLLIICSIIGIWDGFYNGIEHRMSDPVSEHLSNLSHVDVMTVLDGGEAFGILAVMVFPIIFAYATSKKSVKGVVTMVIASMITLVACWMCARYEIVAALIIECFVFWLIYSHKSLNVLIMAAIPIMIAVMLYPFAISNFGWPDLSSILGEYMPIRLHSSSVNTEAAKTIFDIIFDGNLSGIGAGAHALEAVLPRYSTTLSCADVFSASVWLQILFC